MFSRPPQSLWAGRDVYNRMPQVAPRRTGPELVESSQKDMTLIYLLEVFDLPMSTPDSFRSRMDAIIDAPSAGGGALRFEAAQFRASST